MHQPDFLETLIFRASPLNRVNQANGQLTWAFLTFRSVIKAPLWKKKGHATPPSRFHHVLFLVFYHMYFYRLG